MYYNETCFTISENLVRVRALIPSQLQLFHQILVQHEALEAGQTEIAQWLDNAEGLMATLSLTGGKEAVQTNLDRHKVIELLEVIYADSLLFWEGHFKILRT